MKVVEFSCEQEPLITEHCRTYFAARFNQQLARTQIPVSIQLREFQTVLRQEARRQQWYQYTSVGDGLLVPHERRVIYDSPGRPRLLVPDVKIVEAPR